MAAGKNKLYYGDNLEVLQRYVKDESVDLVYLDPPFNSRQHYNVLFAEKDGSQSSSQIHAFEAYLHGSDMMAYLAMMAPRPMEFHTAICLNRFPRRIKS